MHILYERWRLLEPSSNEAKELNKQMLELSGPIIEPKDIQKVRNKK